MSQSNFPFPHEAGRGLLDTVQVCEIEDDWDSSDWITRLLGSGLFRHLTPENSHRFFAELERLSVQVGEVVVEQDDPGEYLYIIIQGRCAVTRRAPGTTRELQLEVLKEGDTFGEGALISGNPRTTTVRMLSDGSLMRLGRRSFENLVRDPTLKSLSFRDACQLVDTGGLWLDVRPHDQRSDFDIDGSVRVPSHLLPLETAALDRTRSYVVFCETGSHSATGAFLLTRLGFEAFVLEGGLEHARTASVSDEPDAAPEPDDATDSATNAGANGQAIGTGAPEGDADGVVGAAHAVASVDPDGERARALHRRNAALMRLITMHRNRHHSLERELDSVRNDAQRAIEAEKERLGGRYKKLRKKFRTARKERNAVQTDLEQQCTRLTQELEATRQRLQRAAVALRTQQQERGRLETQFAESSTRLMQALADKDKAMETCEQMEAALGAALEAMRVQIEGISSLRMEIQDLNAQD